MVQKSRTHHRYAYEVTNTSFPFLIQFILIFVFMIWGAAVFKITKTILITFIIVVNDPLFIFAFFTLLLALFYHKQWTYHRHSQQYTTWKYWHILPPGVGEELFIVIERSVRHSSLSQEEWKAIRSLADGRNIVIKKADKGSCVVMWDFFLFF